MTTKRYTLYLDEIQANSPFKYFCLAGIIIENEIYDKSVRLNIHTICGQTKNNYYKCTIYVYK